MVEAMPMYTVVFIERANGMCIPLPSSASAQPTLVKPTELVNRCLNIKHNFDKTIRMCVHNYN